MRVVGFAGGAQVDEVVDVVEVGADGGHIVEQGRGVAADVQLEQLAGPVDGLDHALLVRLGKLAVVRCRDEARRRIAGTDPVHPGRELGQGELDDALGEELEDLVRQRRGIVEHHHELGEATQRTRLGKRHIHPAQDECVPAGIADHLRARLATICHAAAGLGGIRLRQAVQVGARVYQRRLGEGRLILGEDHLAAQVRHQPIGVGAGRDGVHAKAREHRDLGLGRHPPVGGEFAVAHPQTLLGEEHQQGKHRDPVHRLAPDRRQTTLFAGHRSDSLMP